MKPTLLTREVSDIHVRENFQKLNEFVRTSLLADFQFFQWPLKAGKQTVKHGLGFVPKDVLLLHVSPAATITWHHDESTTEKMSVTASSVCTVRVFLGTYR